MLLNEDSARLAMLVAFADAWNRHDIDAIMALMTTDCVFEASAGPDVCGTRSVGYEDVRAAFIEVWTTFPDAQWRDARHHLCGDLGVSEWTFCGTRTDGTRVEVNGCDLLTFQGDKFAFKNSYRKSRPAVAATPHSSMVQPDALAIPILPCRTVSAIVAFYRRFGFEGGAHESNGEYAILRRGAVELHFFTDKALVPAKSSAGCYIRVLDVESIYRAFASSQLPRSGIPRMDPLENKPWGLREFAVVDIDGNLLRIGQVIER